VQGARAAAACSSCAQGLPDLCKAAAAAAAAAAREAALDAAAADGSGSDDDEDLEAKVDRLRRHVAGEADKATDANTAPPPPAAAAAGQGNTGNGAVPASPARS